LSEYLNGTAYLNEIIRESKKPNLQVITSGTAQDHPSVLLNSGKMHSLIKDLEKRFEIILIDSPIVIGIADVKIIAPAVNQILLIAKCGKVQEENLKLSIKQLSNIHANNLGIIVNEDDEYRHYYPYTSSKEF
jgi:Mrp family chromosome partitioning ATPase